MLRVFVFIFKNALKSTWAIFFCFPATPFQQACRMKANLLHPPGIISIILQKMNLTNPTNPNILNKLSTLEWMKWASVEEDNSLLLKVEGGLPLATAVLLYLSLYQSSDQLLSCLKVFWPNHSWSSLLLLEPYPDFHGMLAAEEAVWSLSPISWPGGHRPSSCSPAPGSQDSRREPRIPALLLPAGKVALVICAHLCTVIIPVTLPCHHDHNSLDLSYQDCNNASFKRCVSSVMYSGCSVARRHCWTLAAVLGVPCGFRHSQDFSAQLYAILLFRSISKPQNHPSLVCWELYALRMHYHPSCDFVQSGMAEVLCM